MGLAEEIVMRFEEAVREEYGQRYAVQSHRAKPGSDMHNELGKREVRTDRLRAELVKLLTSPAPADDGE